MRKDRRNISIAAVAACAAILFILLAVLALYPSSSSRYIDEDHFTGEIVSDTTENKNHGDHEDWVDLNATQTNETDGVTWKTDSDGHTSCEITAAGKYYLSGDLTGGLEVTANGTDSSSRAVVDICLNGHVLDGNGADTALLIGDATESDTTDSAGKVTDEWGNRTYVTVNLYDCGGSADASGNYDNVHYYKYGESVELSDGSTVYKGYDFSDASESDFVGYIRGGLITGGKASNQHYGGGVTVGYDTELNMYGGTVAGNAANAAYAAGGVALWNASFCLYGGSIEGNCNSSEKTTAGGGVQLCPNFIADAGTSGERYNDVGRGYAYFYMSGGEIRDNYTAGRGGGVCAFDYFDSGRHETYFYMSGGVIEGNHAGQGGGGVYVRGESSSAAEAYFHMSGGEIRDNSAIGGGAGIRMHSACDCIISGGRITGNRSIGTSQEAAGFYCYDVKNGTTLTIAGSAYIYGNYANGRKSNFGEYLVDYVEYAHITLGTLTAGARIGVTCPSDQTQITNASSSSSDYLKYFWSDDSAYEVAVNGSGSSSYIELVART